MCKAVFYIGIVGGFGAGLIFLTTMLILQRTLARRLDPILRERARKNGSIWNDDDSFDLLMRSGAYFSSISIPWSARRHGFDHQEMRKLAGPYRYMCDLFYYSGAIVVLTMIIGFIAMEMGC